MSGNVVVRLCEDNSGFIWIGTADGGLCRYDPENFRCFAAILCPAPATPENVNALCADGNKIWVGTYTKGAGARRVNRLVASNTGGRGDLLKLLCHT